MNLQKIYNKISPFLLSVFIINLLVWNLALPIKAAADCDPKTQTCYSCDSETKKCYKDDAGYTSCPIKCNNECSGELSTGSDSPLTPSCGGGGGAVPVYIVGSQEQDIAETIASSKIEDLSDLANLTGLAKEAKQDLIDTISKGLPIPSELKNFAINVVNQSDLSAADKKTLIDAINAGQAIPENLRQTFAALINKFEDIIDLVENKILDLIKSGLDIAWICNSLANAATALPWGMGAIVSQAIAMACPPILSQLLSSLGVYATKQKVEEEMKQTIPVPTFKFFQWEVGIPGFIKSGQIFKFK